MNRELLANILGKCLSALMMLVSLPFLIDAIGPNGYAIVGLFAAVQSVLMLLDGGISAAYTKNISNSYSRGDNLLTSVLMKQYFITFLKVSFLLFFVSLVLFTYFASSHGDSQSEINIIMSASLSLIFLQIYYQATLCGTGYQVIFNKLYISFSIIRYPVATFVVLHFDLNVFAYLLMFFIANIIYTGVLQLVVKNKFVHYHGQYNGMFEINENANVKDKSFKNKMLFLVVMSSLCFQSDKLILAKFVSSEILGYYSLAFTIASFPMIFTSAFYYYLFPKLVVLKASNQMQHYEAEITKNSLIMMIGITSICIYAAAYSKYVLLLFFGNEVLAREVSEILKYLILGSLIQGILMIPYCAQLAFGRISYLVKVNVFLGMVMIAVQIYAASYLTPIDVAKCWLAYNVVTLVVIFLNLKNITGIENKYKWIAIGTFLPILICVLTLFVTHFLLNVLTNINELLIIVPSGIVSLLLIAAYAFYMMRHIDGK